MCAANEITSYEGFTKKIDLFKKVFKSVINATTLPRTVFFYAIFPKHQSIDFSIICICICIFFLSTIFLLRFYFNGFLLLKYIRFRYSFVYFFHLKVDAQSLHVFVSLYFYVYLSAVLILIWVASCKQQPMQMLCIVHCGL